MTVRFLVGLVSCALALSIASPARAVERISPAQAKTLWGGTGGYNCGAGNGPSCAGSGGGEGSACAICSPAASAACIYNPFGGTASCSSADCGNGTPGIVVNGQCVGTGVPPAPICGTYTSCH